MSDLKAMCLDAGFVRVETYIASGNVVFDSRVSQSRVKAELEGRLRGYAGKPISVVVRSASEMLGVLKANPFAKADPKFTYAIFLDGSPPGDALKRMTGQTDEKVRLGAREFFIHCPNGMGRSKLKIPDAKDGTARNMSTVAKLAEMASSP